jgi:hypothetical protein
MVSNKWTESQEKCRKMEQLTLKKVNYPILLKILK